MKSTFSLALILFTCIIVYVASQPNGGFISGPFPTPLRNGNSFQGLGTDNTCADSPNLITNYWWQVLLQKHQQFKVLKDHLHPLVISPQLNSLAYNHSYFDMALTDTVNSNGYYQRRQTIEQHATEWLTRLDIQPDPKYPPLGIVSIDEVYGAGDNPSSAWVYILDYAQQIIATKPHVFIGVGVYCQPLSNSFSNNHAAYWWVTLILVDTCFNEDAYLNSTDVTNNSTDYYYYRDPTDPESGYFCCDVNETASQYSTCFDTLGNDSSITLIVDSPSGEVTVCCDRIELNASNAVPAQSNDYTGTAIATTYIGPNEDTTCFCVNHTVPTVNQPDDAAVGDRVNAVEIHFGKRGFATPGVPLYDFDEEEIQNQDLRGCWNWGAEGLCFENIIAGNFYIEIRTPNSGLNSLIRGQLECAGPSFYGQNYDT